MNHRIKDNKYKPLSEWAMAKYGAKFRPDQIKVNDKPDCHQLWKVFFGQYFIDNPGELKRFSSLS